jgi:hypothetical protein
MDCHVNYLAYSSIDDTFYLSDWTSSTYTKISRTGDLLWVLNGEGATISGTNWEKQHGIHVLAPDHVLVFSNGNPATAHEFQLDLTAMAATEVWGYDGGVETNFGGDIQRLDNGNTLITYSSGGEIHEVNANSELVQRYAFPIGTTVSYSEKRPTLYGGPPPKIHALEP